MYQLGISAYYHDAAAALLHNGQIIAAAQEERFTRVKHDRDFPRHAVLYCLKEAGIQLDQIHDVTFYDKPLVKFERLLETYISYAPAGLRSFIAAMPVWLKEKLFLKKTLKDELRSIAQEHELKDTPLPLLLFAEHHQSHAASAFFPSPHEEAAVLCLDGVGEWATTSAWLGQGNHLKKLWEIDFPHSLGLLYSAFTYYTGFKVNSGEYKIMGLAPYGEPKYVDLIYKHLIDLKEDGTFRLDMKYFNYAQGLTMTNRAFAQLFGGPRRTPESEVTQKEMDLARSIQVVTEEVVLRLARSLHKETGAKALCLAGGVALNCVANGRILRESPFEHLWIQPAAGDAGGAIGSAYASWCEHHKQPRPQLPAGAQDRMSGSYLGPRYTDEEISKSLNRLGAVGTTHTPEQLTQKVAKVLAQGNVVGWFQGRMEFGPRALGGRSIIGDPRNTKMQSVMNLKIKYRESFRPFAPAVLAEDVEDYFDIRSESPYMLLVAPVTEKRRKKMTESEEALFGIEKLNVPRSDIPAVTHVDYSARIQTVHKETNPRFYQLLQAFKKETDCSVLVNTSFNVRGEPIVCTPEDAYRCFMRTEMDYLVLENTILAKTDQPHIEKWKDESWKNEFELD